MTVTLLDSQGFSGEGNGNPLQYSCLENPVDSGAWWAAVCGVAKSRTRLGDFNFTFRFHASEKEMATYSSILAWRIPGTGEPGGLPSMGSHRVGHDWSDLAAAAAAAARFLCAFLFLCVLCGLFEFYTGSWDWEEHQMLVPCKWNGMELLALTLAILSLFLFRVSFMVSVELAVCSSKWLCGQKCTSQSNYTV